MRNLICLMFVLNLSQAKADESPPYNREKLKLSSVVTEIPATSIDFIKSSFRQEAIPGWAAILVSSSVLYHYDADIYEGTQKTGRRWGLSNSDKTKTVLKLGQYDLLRLPTDTASSLYFLGDGWLDIMAAGGFFAAGYFGDHLRPYNTSLQLVHGMVVSGIFGQILKRSSGRESPSDRSNSRGRWRPFPSFSAYNKNTAKYDAMPSGHVMTTTMVFTIIRSNYAEYDKFLLPLEVAWLTALGFAMLNNGVHWASDYPLAIGMGYLIGKSSLKIGQKKKEIKEVASNWTLLPGIASDGVTSTCNFFAEF